MHNRCLNCGLKFEIEPGFFYGAMFVSYVMVVGITIFIIVGSILVDSNRPVWQLTLLVVAIVILLMPVIFRYSRVLFLYWFGGIQHGPDS